MPNLMPFLLAAFVGSLIGAILAAVGLEFLGLGATNISTLGNILYWQNFYNAVIRGMWWWWGSPIAIFIILFAGLFIASIGLRVKITDIRLSVFQLPTQTPFFNLELEPLGDRNVWRSVPTRPHPTEYHVLHVDTDEGIEGVCTVGDARYTTMRTIDLEYLRHLAIGEDPA